VSRAAPPKKTIAKGVVNTSNKWSRGAFKQGNDGGGVFGVYIAIAVILTAKEVLGLKL